MKENQQHTNLNAVDQTSNAFFKGGKFAWTKSADEVWSSIESEIEEQPRIRFLNSNFVKMAVAASMILLVSLGIFMKLYKIQIQTSAGQHLSAELPDHSRIEMNAESKISYHPYWWIISRNVEFEGEACFEVQKGRNFAVKSAIGTTQVLGTSFNIFARDDQYKVTCLSGKVRVTVQNGAQVVLSPNDKAELQTNGQLKVSQSIEVYPEVSWKENVFIFTAVPIHQVFAEIERQYGMKFDLPVGDASLYTGNFSKDQNIEEILNYVCPALGLKYIRKSGVEFKISYLNE